MTTLLLSTFAAWALSFAWQTLRLSRAETRATAAEAKLMLVVGQRDTAVSRQTACEALNKAMSTVITNLRQQLAAAENALATSASPAAVGNYARGVLSEQSGGGAGLTLPQGKASDGQG